MSDALDVLDQVGKWKASGKGVALATVITTWGSSPRPVGSQLGVDDTGAMVGSVSGGCIEGAVVKEALASIADGKPRLVDIKGIRVDAEFGKSMIYVTNEDKPGFIGHFAGILGDAKINIATFHLGRTKQGGDAIALVEIDGAVPSEVLAKVQALPQVKQAKALRF